MTDHERLVHTGDREGDEVCARERKPEPEQRTCLGWGESHPQRLRREDDQQDCPNEAACHTTDCQAHGTVAGPRERDGHCRAEPGVGLVGDHSLALAETPLQQRGRCVGEAVEAHDDPEHADDARRRWCAHRGRIGWRAEETAAVYSRANDQRDRGYGGSDLAGIALPADDGEAHAQLVEGQDGLQRDIRHRVRAKGARAKQPGKNDPDGNSAESAQDRARETPAEGPGRLAAQRLAARSPASPPVPWRASLRMAARATWAPSA